MNRWDEQFCAVSRGPTASFGSDPYDDVIGASTLEVTTSPTPRAPFSFDLSRVPAPVFLALSVAGVALVAASAYSLGEANEWERHERLRGQVRVSHVRRKPLLGYEKERAWALREALNRTPSGSTYLGATRKDVA